MYLERFRLDGRVAVVTGAGQGIGYACAQALGEAGATVVIAELDPERARAAAASLAASGVTARAETLDVRDSAAIASLARTLHDELGGVDILVNNAGIAASEVPAERADDAHWRHVMSINLDGVFWCCREFGRFMLERGRGAIVNIGSMSGLIVNKPQEQCAYNSSKAAVHHLTRSLAVEWATRGVRVNAVAPTYIATPLTLFGAQNEAMLKTWLDMTPLGRMGQPDEIASAVLFLASDASSLLTGSVVSADGGYTCL